MPAASSAELTRVVPFPDDVGEPLWRETRAFPLLATGGPVVTFLAIGAFAVRPLVLHVLLAAAAIAVLSLCLRAADAAVIETYTVSERFVAIEQRRGGRVAVPIERLIGATVAGDTVRLHSRDGVVTLGFVRRRRALLRALEAVAPGLRIAEQLDPLCPT
jgi:hypothetical protein